MMGVRSDGKHGMRACDDTGPGGNLLENQMNVNYVLWPLSSYDENFVGVAMCLSKSCLFDG